MKEIKEYPNTQNLLPMLGGPDLADRPYFKHSNIPYKKYAPQYKPKYQYQGAKIFRKRYFKSIDKAREKLHKYQRDID